MKLHYLRKLILALFLLAFITVANANQSERYLEKVNEFIALVSNYEKTNTIARIKLPKVKHLLQELSNKEKYLNKKRYYSSELNDLFMKCKGTKSVMDYYRFGSLEQPSFSLVGLYNEARNTFTYQSELELIHPFIIACFGKAIPALEDFIKKLPRKEMDETRIQGLKEISLGVSTVYFSALLASNIKEIKTSYKEALLKELDNNAFYYIPLISVTNRNACKKIIEKKIKHSPQSIKPYLLRIKKSMDMQTCSPLVNKVFNRCLI